MLKKTLAFMLTAVILLAGCSNSSGTGETTTESVAQPSEAWEYEMYIEDLDYFAERYYQGLYSAQSAFSMMNEADAKKHMESVIDALTNLEGVIYPPSLEEVHGQFLQTVEIQKELAECRMDLAGFLSEYPDFTPEERAEYDKVATRMSEISGRISEGGHAFYSKWIAAQNAAFSYLQNGEYRAYAMELENIYDMYVEEFNKFYDIYFNGIEGDIAIHLDNCLTILSNMGNMTVPEQLKSCHEEIKKAISSESDAIQALMTITELYRQYPGTDFADLPADVQNEIQESGELFEEYFSENNTDYYALDEAVTSALEAANTQAGQ